MMITKRTSKWDVIGNMHRVKINSKFPLPSAFDCRVHILRCVSVMDQCTKRQRDGVAERLLVLLFPPKNGLLFTVYMHRKKFEKY